MVYKYKKPYRVKKRKPIFKNRFFRLGILTLIFLFSTSYFLFFSEIFQVEKIVVTGDEKVPTEDMKSLIEKNLENKIIFLKTKSIFLLDLAKIEKDILGNFPQIAELELHRGFPDALNIIVIERLGVAQWCKDDKCFVIDKEGITFEEVSTETDLIKISGPKEMLKKEKIAQILEIQAKLKEQVGITTTQAIIDSEERLNIETFEGWEIYFNLKGDLNWQIQELGLVLEKQVPPEKRKKLEYVDLRFSRVYYKFLSGGMR